MNDTIPTDAELDAAMRYFEAHPESDEAAAARIAVALLTDCDEVLCENRISRQNRELIAMEDDGVCTGR